MNQPHPMAGENKSLASIKLENQNLIDELNKLRGKVQIAKEALEYAEAQLEGVAVYLDVHLKISNALAYVNKKGK